MAGGMERQVFDKAEVGALDWLCQIYSQPLFDLIQQARNVYLKHWKNNEVQLCTLLSIKTGGCSEDSAYCAQSPRYDTSIETRRLLSTPPALKGSHRAQTNHSSRFCMRATWQNTREDTSPFES